MQCSNLTVDGSKQQCVKRSRNVYVHNVYELNCWAPGFTNNIFFQLAIFRAIFNAFLSHLLLLINTDTFNIDLIYKFAGLIDLILDKFAASGETTQN